MRSSGILLHISSLPSAFGIGDLGPQAHVFIDFLKASKQRHWQILPINPTDGINAHSPYSCMSAFAGNPLLISPQLMVIDGQLSVKDLKDVPTFPKDEVAFERIKAYKEKLLSSAYKYWAKSKDTDNQFKEFCRVNAFWLDDYCMFTAGKKKWQGQSWRQWPKGLRLRQPNALKSFLKANRSSIEEAKFIQYVFFSQWQRLLAYAHHQGISIIGDIPIYVNFDSADVWCHPTYFKLTPQGDLKYVSGCPPDYFSKTGQRWGNPVYDWQALKKKKYDWWVNRITHNLSLFDHLRIDHFRGFESFWQIPAHERLAVFGQWVKAPGQDFFRTLKKHFKHLSIIAEDLGEITPQVKSLMKEFNFAGMRVLLFGFNGDLKHNPHFPANYIPHCVAYSGTHDNNTIVGWVVQEAKPHELNNVKKLLRVPRLNIKAVHWQLIEKLMACKADTVIIPMQDVLGLGQGARMNLPSTTVHNWSWRFKTGDVTKKILGTLQRITKKNKRG